MNSSKRNAKLAENNPLREVREATLTDTTSTEEQPRRKGRKPQLKGSKQTTIILEKQQLTWLAEKCIEATLDNGISTNKTAIIRALIDTAREVELELTGIKSEEEIIQRFKEAVVAR